MFRCKKCNNSDSRYIGYINNTPYCRKCILLKDKPITSLQDSKQKNIKANIDYALTEAQQKASKEILSFIKKNESVAVDAVCGAGKTELIYESIEFFLNQNKKVGFVIPRKDVVIEIYSRLKKDYHMVNVTSVYGGNTDNLNGQIIVLTAYQLYRYDNFFDLIILDECDAFPFYNTFFLKRASKGVIIYLSATFETSFIKQIKNRVVVNKRFHNHKLPIPIIKRSISFFNIIILKKQINDFKLLNKQVLIFIPTIEIGKQISKHLNIPFVYSYLFNKQVYIDKFKSKKINILLTTSILERGITIDDVQVIVFKADHYVYDYKTLIQICGRVGRKKTHPDGKIIFICTAKTEAIKKCIKTLNLKNSTIV